MYMLCVHQGTQSISVMIMYFPTGTDDCKKPLNHKWENSRINKELNRKILAQHHDKEQAQTHSTEHNIHCMQKSQISEQKHS